MTDQQVADAIAKCERIMDAVRKNQEQFSPSLAPVMVQQVQYPLQESKEAEPSITTSCDETNSFDDPTVQHAMDDIEAQSGVLESPTEWDDSVGLMLFNVSRKYGLDWAVLGGPTMLAARSESGRDNNIEVKDKIRLPEGTMFDILKHLNVHLDVPHANEIEQGIKQVLQEAPTKVR